MPHPRTHRLVVLGGDRVGKTAIIEQFIFGNHVVGQVLASLNLFIQNVLSLSSGLCV